MQCISIEGGFYNCPQNCVFDSPFTNTGKSSATPKTVLRNLADLLEDEQL